MTLWRQQTMFYQWLYYHLKLEIVSQDTDEEDVNDNPDGMFEPAGQLEVEEEVGENEDEPTRGKRRRLDSRWLQATHFDTDIQPTLMPRNGDLMSLGEMSPYTIWQRFFTEDMIEYVTTCTNLFAIRQIDLSNNSRSQKFLNFNIMVTTIFFMIFINL